MPDFPAVDESLYRRIAGGGTAWLPLVDRAVWRVTGEDRARYLNGQVTNDVSKLAPGRSLYAAVLTGKGKIVGDLFIAATAEALFLDAPLALRDTLRERFEKFLIADDATFEDVTDGGSLSHWFGTVPPAPAPGRIVSANARFGLPGFDVWQPGAEPCLADSVADSALAELFRIEHAIGLWGREIDGNTLPQEVLFDRDNRGLSYTKGCYVGQETVARIRSLGHVNRKLVFLEATAPASMEGTDLHLRCDGEEAGRITSWAFSPLLGKNVALGMVGRQFLDAGRSLRACSESPVGHVGGATPLPLGASDERIDIRKEGATTGEGCRTPARPAGDSEQALTGGGYVWRIVPPPRR